jgi:hypothetical protein
MSRRTIIQYGYVFSANGKTYIGWQSPKKDGLEIGRNVAVYYDPKRPEKNALTDFEELSMGCLGPIPWELAGIGASLCSFVPNDVHTVKSRS